MLIYCIFFLSANSGKLCHALPLFPHDDCWLPSSRRTTSVSWDCCTLTAQEAQVGTEQCHRLECELSRMEHTAKHSCIQFCFLRSFDLCQSFLGTVRFVWKVVGEKTCWFMVFPLEQGKPRVWTSPFGTVLFQCFPAVLKYVCHCHSKRFDP